MLFDIFINWLFHRNYFWIQLILGIHLICLKFMQAKAFASKNEEAFDQKFKINTTSFVFIQF